ncbi:hypothetical protein ACO0OE_003658 [Hanseniaspora uvarum]|jgi:hypothetical protein|nr:hypothetical protein DAHU10_035500 [Hanseniaspora uvarum]
MIQNFSKTITKKHASNKMFMAAYAVAFASVTLTTLVPCDKGPMGRYNGINNDRPEEEELVQLSSKK